MRGDVLSLPAEASRPDIILKVQNTQISPKLSLNRNIHRHTNMHSDVKIQNESSA